MSDQPLTAPTNTADTASGRVRVVVVAHGPPVRGGVSTVAMDLVQDPVLNEQFEVVFLNTSQNEGARGKFGLENIRRAVIDSANTLRLARRGGVVHSHSVQEPWLTAWRQVAIALAARVRGSSVLLHHHAGPPYMEPAGRYRVSRANRWAFAVLDRLAVADILIAPAGEANLRPYLPNIDLPVIANSVEVTHITPTSAVHEPPVVLFIGELLESKGILTLLDALDRLDEQGTKYELRIVGDNRPGLDPAKDAMVAAIAGRGRAEAMTGPIDRSEVYRHLSEADLFVLPTWSEGQPFTVIEALAAGVPIVASDIQSISAMIRDGEHGRLVDPHDTVGFAAAMGELLADPERRRQISATNRGLAFERFDRAVFRERIAELYRRHGRTSSGDRG